MGAQRLSASLSSARSWRVRSRAWRECSTPFGITELGIPVIAATSSRHRAQRLSASLSSTSRSGRWRRLASDQGGSLHASADRAGAQRLSASLSSTSKSSPGRAELSAQPDTEVGLPIGGHQGKGVAFGIKGRNRLPIGAQRLSASQRSAYQRHVPDRTEHLRAQRLSASQRSA